MRRYRPTLGFTLVELLVSITITLIIVVILFQVFAATAKQWQSSDQRIDTFRDARAVLQLMSRELSRADINGDPKMLRLADPFSDYAREVYAVTPIPNEGKGDLCAIGYYCAYDGITKAFSLKRAFKNSDDTYTFLANSPPDYDMIFQKDSKDEVVAAYAWDLQVRPGIGKDIVATTTDPATWDWLEIRFKSMSPASGRKIRDTAVDVPTWSDPTSPLYQTFILPYEQQFVSRIALRQHQ